MEHIETEPSDDELNLLAAEAEMPEGSTGKNELDDLFEEAEKHHREHKLRKPQKPRDPSMRDSLDAASRKLREIYTNPDNWKLARGLVLIDKETSTVIGNFREYLHSTTTARILRREHQPMQIDGQEIVEGYLGHRLEEQLRGITWDEEKSIVVHVTLDEVQVEAPLVSIKTCLQFNSILRATLEKDTQFANGSGTTLLLLKEGTNIWDAANSDTKAAMRKAVL